MRKNIITQLFNSFNDKTNYTKTNVEVWFARDLQKLLQYSDWRKFLNVIEKAKVSCSQAKNKITDHFVQVDKKVLVGSGAEREIFDIALTRYACYLIAQNGDSKKGAISFAQNYFAIQTRKQELLEKRLQLQERFDARQKLTETEKELSRNIFERGVDNAGFSRIRSKGDKALFGGKNTAEMKGKLSVPKGRPLADFLPTVTIKAKDFATELTNFNVKRNDLQGEPKISQEHLKNNVEVRGLMKKQGIIPEDLPSATDIKKLERRTKKDEKNLAKKQIN